MTAMIKGGADSRKSPVLYEFELPPSELCLEMGRRCMKNVSARTVLVVSLLLLVLIADTLSSPVARPNESAQFPQEETVPAADEDVSLFMRALECCLTCSTPSTVTFAIKSI